MNRVRFTPVGFSLLVLALALGVAVPLAGCGGDSSAASGPLTAPLDRDGRDIADLDVPGVDYDENGDPQGLARYIRWSEKIGQGAQPIGEISFKNLAALGYKAVLSVDGAIPEVELAEKYGLRYVHVPIGYDGIPEESAKQILASTNIDGPIYVHCHHGKHRGPCAAQLMRMQVDGVTPGVGILGLERSGTNKDYRGLWQTVLDFRGMEDGKLTKVADLPKAVIPKGVRAGMVDMNLRWDFLKLSKKAGWKTPPNHPDVSPPHEAKMLWELFREMHRNDEEAKEYGDVFMLYLKESEKGTIALEKALRAEDIKAASKFFAEVQQLCKDCHRDYRD